MIFGKTIPIIYQARSFQLISTSLCLEVACSTYVEYKAAVKKLVALLKPGGFLTMFIVERQTFYMVTSRGGLAYQLATQYT